jgi:hypothetical protein
MSGCLHLHNNTSGSRQIELLGSQAKDKRLNLD